MTLNAVNVSVFGQNGFKIQINNSIVNAVVTNNQNYNLLQKITKQTTINNLSHSINTNSAQDVAALAETINGQTIEISNCLITLTTTSNNYALIVTSTSNTITVSGLTVSGTMVATTSASALLLQMTGGSLTLSSSTFHVFMVSATNSGLICGNINTGTVAITTTTMNSSVQFSGSGTGTLFGTVSGTITMDTLVNVNMTGTFVAKSCASGCSSLTENTPQITVSSFPLTTTVSGNTVNYAIGGFGIWDFNNSYIILSTAQSN